jgi:hypothetical protein
MIKVSRRNSVPTLTQPQIPVPVPAPRRKPSGLLLDRYGRRIGAPPEIFRPWIWVPRPLMMPFPGIMPQQPMGLDAGVTYDTLTMPGNGTTGTTSVTLATHQAGDVIFVVAMRTADGTTVISTPANWTKHSSDSANNRRIDFFWRVAPGAGTTATGFTNAERCLSWIFRGADQTTPIGDYGYVVDGSSDPTDFAGLTLQRTNSTSWVCLVGVTRAGTGSTTLDTGTVTGTTRQGGGAIGTTGAYGYWDSNAPVSSWSSRTYADTGNASGQITLTFEVRAATL